MNALASGMHLEHPPVPRVGSNDPTLLAHTMYDLPRGIESFPLAGHFFSKCHPSKLRMEGQLGVGAGKVGKADPDHSQVLLNQTIWE